MHTTNKKDYRVIELLQGLQNELSHVNVLFFPFQGYSDIRESPFF